MLICRDHLGQLPFRLVVLRLFRQIGPLVGIHPVMVEFLGAVFVADVAPVFGADGGIAFAVGRDRRCARSY